jgi:hypothetical protein
MVQKLISEIGGGIIYVNVPKNIKDFTKNFAQATGFAIQLDKGVFSLINRNIFGRTGTLIIFFYNLFL